MARPIPRHVLPQSATHRYGAVTKDEWGNETRATSATLSYVRFDPSSKLVTGKDNKQVQLSAVLFFDCRNSTTSGTAAFALGDKIERGSTVYTIVGGVDPLYDAGRAHHWELELV